jgi:hypothetical protein
LAEVSGVVLLFFFLANLRLAIVLAVAFFLAIDYVRTTWLRFHATVRWINQGSMERRAAGRWTPD